MAAAAVTPAPMRTNVAVIVIFFALLTFISTSEATLWWKKESKKQVTITNIDEVEIAVRCFSFEDATMEAIVLKPHESFSFSFEQNPIFPLSTMWNCSTYRGTFIAFVDYYDCNKKNLCEWSFDRKKTYRRTPFHDDKWIPYNFNPNFQSEVRGGVFPQPQTTYVKKENTTEYD